MKKKLFLLVLILFVPSFVIFADDPAVMPDGTLMESGITGQAAPPADNGAALMPAAPGADNSLPGMEAMPGDSGTFPGDTAANPANQAPAQVTPDNSGVPGMEAMPGETGAAMMPGGDIGASAGGNITAPGGNASAQVDIGAGTGANGSSQVDIGANASLPGDNGALPGADMGAAPGDASLPGMTGDISAAPAGKEDANVMFSGTNNPQAGTAPQQAVTASGKPGTAKAKAKAVTPSYKAVPMTNDIRVMDKTTGELGQTESLKRYMGWGVECSSKMKPKHGASNTADLNAYTAWVVNKGESGMGQYLKLVFDPIYFAAIQEGEVNSVKITGLKIINGYNRSHDDWNNNARVRTMKIYHNKSLFCKIELYDTTNWQEIFFKKAMIIKPGDTMKAVITDYFEGYKYPNACITEFLPVGKPNGVVVGSEYMDGQPKTNVRNGGMYD
jgi:hypothetical protein